MKTIKVSLLTIIFLTFSFQSLYSELKEGDNIGNLQMQMSIVDFKNSYGDERIFEIQPSISFIISDKAMVNVGIRYGTTVDRGYNSTRESSVFGLTAGYGFINQINSSLFLNFLIDGNFNFLENNSQNIKSIGLKFSPAFYYNAAERLYFSAKIGLLDYTYFGLQDSELLHVLTISFGTVSLGVHYDLN